MVECGAGSGCRRGPRGIPTQRLPEMDGRPCGQHALPAGAGWVDVAARVNQRASFGASIAMHTLKACWPRTSGGAPLLRSALAVANVVESGQLRSPGILPLHGNMGGPAHCSERLVARNMACCAPSWEPGCAAWPASASASRSRMPALLVPQPPPPAPAPPPAGSSPAGACGTSGWISVADGRGFENSTACHDGVDACRASLSVPPGGCNRCSASAWCWARGGGVRLGRRAPQPATLRRLGTSR